jgi:hypothetical protein
MIVGLGFQARVGKGEVAARLCLKHGFTEVAFADALKEACRVIFGLTKSQLYGDDKDRPDAFWNDTPRNILQLVGTECLRRGYRDDVWVKAVERIMREHEGQDFVISDCRFPNEAEAIRSWGGKLVKIVRVGAPIIATSGHASESALATWDAWDYTLFNNGTLEDLATKVDWMVDGLRGTR